jgi:hypothetical protein
VRRQTPLILTLVLAVVALGGCGSASSTSSGGSPSSAETAASDGGSLTKAEFIAEADALCEASKAKQESLRTKIERLAQQARGEERSRGTVSDGTRRELAQTLELILASAEAGLSQVQGLGSPKADAGQLETIFQKTESAFAASRAYAAALEGHEDARAQAVAERGNAETRETAGLAKQYGFEVCGAEP